MIDSWAMLLGWPALVAAVGLAVTGVVRGNPWLPAASIVLVLPVSLYLAGSPRFSWLGILGPLLFAVCALAVRRGHRLIAWTSLAMVTAGIGSLALVVVKQ